MTLKMTEWAERWFDRVKDRFAAMAHPRQTNANS